jgi:penicillin-binding protein 1A
MLRFLFRFLLALTVLATLAVGGALAYLIPRLPSIESLREVQFQVPLRVFDQAGGLIAEFGEKRRTPITYAEVPEIVKQAFLAAEDDHFFQHSGVDWIAIVRAALSLIETGEKKQGGSTITMQVARNFFLTREKTYIRKINEILLALKIEKQLTKKEILELYLNKIYLGHRAYGVAAAAQVYYGSNLDHLSLAQAAMIAGLPKAPSILNPITNPERALERRNYVLNRMLKLGYIGSEQFYAAESELPSAKLHTTKPDVAAPHLAEMVRRFMLDRYGEEAYEAGYQVFTTVRGDLQAAANAALRSALLAYDRRHGYRGPEQKLAVNLSEPQDLEALLGDFAIVNGLLPALVLKVDEKSVLVYAATHGEVVLDWEGLSWARPHIDQDRTGARPTQAADILAIGDVIRVMQDEEGNWRLAQIPAVEGALLSLRPNDGAVQALAGGFDFYQSKFNRVTQARRQPGSGFKPFIYSAALESGFTTASFVNDAPLVFDGADLGTGWRPENYSGKYFGPTRLREALANSRNLVSIRLMQAMGVGYTLDYVAKFRFDTSSFPQDLSLSLGSGAISPWELARGYTVFANGGYLTEPYFIESIVDSSGQVVYQADPPRACRECLQAGLVPEDEGKAYAPLVIDPQNAWLVASMMQDVIKRGTGRRALVLNRNDLSGKTGTTNDQKDAWFSGFNTQIVTTAWVGFDDAEPLGRRETGAVAALPMWIDYMKVALHGIPESPLGQPPGLVTVRIDPDTGLLAGAGNPRAVFETFRENSVPERGAYSSTLPDSSDEGLTFPQQLF